MLLSILSVVLLAAIPACAAEIHEAAGEGDLAKIKALVSEDSNLIHSKNERGSTPLHSASFGGHAEVVGFLVDKGADIEAVNGGGFTPLQLASYGGHREVVKLLLDKGADINAVNKRMNMTALDFAFMAELQAGKLDIAPFLIEKGAEFDVNRKNQFGYATLDMAIVFGNTEAAEYLLRFGPDISTPRRDGKTPLINAIFRGRPEIAKLLLEKGADVNTPDDEGQPPVFWAVKKGLVEILQDLVAKGASTDFVDKDHGRTLLHISALQGHREVVEILLDKKTDPNAKDDGGKTPFYYAARYGHKTVADLLTRSGAKRAGDIEENFGKSLHLTRKLKDGEAVAWYLAHRGWAVKTKSHMFIFDAEEFGVTRPTEPSLANGFLTTHELSEQNVFAIYTSYHGEPGEPAYVHTIEDSVANIRYVHNEGDPWRGSEGTVYMKPREEKTFDDVRIVSALDPGNMPMLAYLCMVDGLNIFYSGFQPEDIDKYKEEIDFLTQYTTEVDLAFLPIAEPGEEDSASIYFLEKLHPKHIVPLDPDHRVHLYPDVAKMVAEKGFKTRVFCAENPGDHLVSRASEGK
jgi:ankyrin repeat protein